MAPTTAEVPITIRTKRLIRYSGTVRASKSQIKPIISPLVYTNVLSIRELTTGAAAIPASLDVSFCDR